MSDNGKLFIVGLFLGLTIGTFFISAFLIGVIGGGKTKFCPECGERYQSNYSYCGNDGAVLVALKD